MEEEKKTSAYERKYAKALEDGQRLRKTYRPRADIRSYLSRTYRLKADDLNGIMSTLYESAKPRVREGIVSTKDGEKTFDELYGKGIALTEEDEAYAQQFARCFESANETRPNRLREASRPFMGYTDQKLSYLLSHYQQRNSEWDAKEADRRVYATQIRRLQAEIDLRAARKEKADAKVKVAESEEKTGERLMESIADMPDWMDGALKGFLRENYQFKESEGGFYGSIDPDYRDELDKATIKKILSAKNPREEFDSLLDEGDFLGVIDDQYTLLMGDLMKGFDDWAKAEGFEEADDAFEAWEDDIDQWVHSNVSFSFNSDKYLKVDVHAVLMVDSGDGNYDFTLNTEFDDGEVDDAAGIVWLAKTQGYSKEDVEAAINGGEYKDSKFLKSLVKEVANCTTSMNAVTFLQDVELKDLVDREPGDEAIDVGTECGLFDPWNGAGGMFEIVLEKPVTVPKDFVWSYSADGVKGSYGVQDVYGQWLG